MSTMREISRQNWKGEPNNEDISGGSLQRIADAVEKMAGSYSSIIDERDRYKRWYEEEQERVKRLERSKNSLRGAITRLKKASKK